MKAENEYVDLIDVLKFIWSAKLWIAGGVIAGLVVAGLLISRKETPLYITSVPIALDASDASTPGTISERFYKMLQKPGFKEALGSNLNDPSLKSIFVGGGLPFRINTTDSPLKFVLEIDRYEGDPSGEKALFVAQALVKASRDYKRTSIEKYTQFQKDGAGQQPRSDLEIDVAKLVAQQTAEEMVVKSKMRALAQKISKAGANSTEPPEDTIAKAISDAKTTESERKKMIADYADLAGSLKTIQLKYEPAVRDLSSGLAILSPQLIELIVGVPTKIPTFSVNLEAYKFAVSEHTQERYESKTPLALALGVMMGGFIGFLVFASVAYIKKNKARFA